MRLCIRLARAVLLLAAFAVPAAAQTVLFNAPRGSSAYTLNAGPTPSAFASPFTVDRSASLASVELYFSNNNAPSGIVCEVWSGTTLPAASLALSGAGSGPTGGVETVSIPFDGTLQLQPGTSYWVVVRSTLGTNNFSRQNAGGSLASLDTAGWRLLPSAAGLSFRVFGNLPPSGACCNPTSAGCATLPAAECANFGGVYRGDNSLCAVPLCFAVGACCRSTTCEILTQSACAALTPTAPPGRWLGAGTVCPAPGQPNLCCPADINGSGVRDVSDIFAFLSAWFAGCP